jgi:HSP20 family molecular chaperone IbpA
MNNFTPLGFDTTEQEYDKAKNIIDAATQYVERTNEGDEFTIYTKGTYPKLRVMKVFDDRSSITEIENFKEGTLKGLDIIATVPGIPEEEIEVNVLGQEITIEIKPSEKLDQTLVILNEIPTRYSKVVIGITGPFEMTQTEAKFENNGLLHIYIPAIEKPKSRKLELSTKTT